jgi:hypothetical protein
MVQPNAGYVERGRAIRVVLGVLRGCRPWWGGLSAGYSPQPGYSQLSSQIPLCTPSPTSAPDTARTSGHFPDEKLGSMAKAFPTVCKRMHEHRLRKSKLYRSVANARIASDANTSAALRQTIAVSNASAGRANVGTIGRSRPSSVGFFARTMGNPSLMEPDSLVIERTFPASDGERRCSNVDALHGCSPLEMIRRIPRSANPRDRIFKK